MEKYKIIYIPNETGRHYLIAKRFPHRWLPFGIKSRWEIMTDDHGDARWLCDRELPEMLDTISFRNPVTISTDNYYTIESMCAALKIELI